MSVIYVHETTVHNTNASSQVVPELIKMFQPKSVLDVGCGTGTWLRSFIESGVNDVAGMDGDFVNRSLLQHHLTWVENSTS
jgi:ribosomal protein L11 methylase PrmA